MSFPSLKDQQPPLVNTWWQIFISAWTVPLILLSPEKASTEQITVTIATITQPYAKYCHVCLELHMIVRVTKHVPETERYELQQELIHRTEHQPTQTQLVSSSCLYLCSDNNNLINMCALFLICSTQQQRDVSVGSESCFIFSQSKWKEKSKGYWMSRGEKNRLYCN